MGPVGEPNIINPRCLFELRLELSSLSRTWVVIGRPLILVLVVPPAPDPNRWITREEARRQNGTIPIQNAVNDWT